MSDLFVSLDGTDVSGVAIRGGSTRRLNRASTATITIPMDSSIGGAGSPLLISYDGGSTIHFHGMVMDCEVDGGEDTGYVTYNASDPMELWAWRPARDPDGDFTNPTFIETFMTGPQIIQTILENTEGDSTAQGNPALTPPDDAEGPTFLTFGSFETGGLSLEGAPVDWPMTIAQIASLLCSTGELDIVITPTDPGGGVMGTVDCYNGDFGTNLSPFGGGSGAVNFQYGFGDLNVRAMRWNEDMSTICNKLWLYGGPRILTAADPAGNQHWCWNITGDDPDLYGNVDNQFGGLQGGPFATAGPGGALPTRPSYVGGVLGDMRQDSQDGTGTNGVEYGVRMEVRIYDGASDLCNSPLGQAERWLYRSLWQSESWARVYPRELIHITPIRGTEIGTFDIGDLVGVECTSTIRGGFSGAQRVYEYSITWDEDGPFALSELQTSSDTGIPVP